MEQPYQFSARDFEQLLVRSFYPERTDKESAVIREFLARHIHEFDTLSFSVRVGNGATPIPGLTAAVAAQVVRNSKKRIDLLCYKGRQPVIVEVKVRVTPATLGQILTYRHWFLEENPDADEPELVVVGAASDDDTIAALRAHNVTVYIYAAGDAGPDASAGGV
jgi:hypothetical protein